MLRPRLRPHPATLPSHHHANLRPFLLPPPLHLPSPLHLQRTGVRRRRLAFVAPTLPLTSSTTAPGAATTSATSRGGTPRSFPTPLPHRRRDMPPEPLRHSTPNGPEHASANLAAGLPSDESPNPERSPPVKPCGHRSPYNCRFPCARLRVPEPPTPMPPSVPVANFADGRRLAIGTRKWPSRCQAGEAHFPRRRQARGRASARSPRPRAAPLAASSTCSALGCGPTQRPCRVVTTRICDRSCCRLRCTYRRRFLLSTVPSLASQLLPSSHDAHDSRRDARSRRGSQLGERLVAPRQPHACH